MGKSKFIVPVIRSKKTDIFGVMSKLLASLKEAFKAPSLYAIWALTSGLVGFAGPFGTYDRFGFGVRLLFWGVIVGASIAAGTAIRVWVQSLDDKHGYWRSILVASFVVAVFLALPLTMLGDYFASAERGHVPPLYEIAVIIFVIAVSVSASRRLIVDEQTELRSQNAHPDEAEDPPRLLERVSPDERGPIYRVSVDDHYVRLVTEAAETELLMRFSDALKELDGADGMQVHRSHWVARAAVTGHRLEKSRMFLKLVDGAEVPVSRSFRKPVENELLEMQG